MMRKQKYMQMATSSKKGVLPERLPPTEDAIKYHSFRVHLQILQWLDAQVDPTEWGWRNEGDVLVPIMTDKVRREKSCFSDLSNKWWEGWGLKV